VSAAGEPADNQGGQRCPADLAAPGGIGWGPQGSGPVRGVGRFRRGTHGGQRRSPTPTPARRSRRQALPERASARGPRRRGLRHFAVCPV